VGLTEEQRFRMLHLYAPPGSIKRTDKRTRPVLCADGHAHDWPGCHGRTVPAGAPRPRAAAAAIPALGAAGRQQLPRPDVHLL